MPIDKTFKKIIIKLFETSFYLKRVQRFMKQAGIQSIAKKKFRPHTSSASVVERENLLEWDFTTKMINEK
ncbi:transposase [Geobacillus subterraneus]|jgi:putative transposase|uniref:transposase n=1 Tax=Geobacillus subterraneus TaxID=129338 RepID=UPI001442DA93|nr:transposase [Geobacillus subterraneus]QIZ66046.1 transposase [Geobacillus subterraneus]